MNSKFFGWLGLFVLLAFLAASGLLLKLIIGIVLCKVVWYVYTSNPYADINDSSRKGKVKLPAPLAEKLAKRNKM